MSHAFVKEEDDQWLHEIPGTITALINHLTKENNGVRVYEKRKDILLKEKINSLNQDQFFPLFANLLDKMDAKLPKEKQTIKGVNYFSHNIFSFLRKKTLNTYIIQHPEKDLYKMYKRK